MHVKTKSADSATLKGVNGWLSKEWVYVIDGRPECTGIPAFKYLKSLGFTTEEAGKYLRELQGPMEPVQMSADEERHFEL